MSELGQAVSAVASAGEGDFSVEAGVLLRRGAGVYFNRGEAEIVRHVRWMRGERRDAGRTADKLVGMAEGLREALLSWGIPDGNLCPGELDMASYFFDRRRWDFAVVSAKGFPVALIEFKCAGGQLGHGRVRLDVETVAAMCLDSQLAAPGARIFRGAIFVTPEFRRAGALQNESLRVAGERSGTDRLKKAADRLVSAGLADAILALHRDGMSFSPVSDDLSPQTFFRKLHAFLQSLPAETWKRPAARPKKCPVGCHSEFPVASGNEESAGHRGRTIPVRGRKPRRG